VVSDAQVGLTKAIRRQLQGCSWQRCSWQPYRVHFARNLLQRVPKAHQGTVTAALRSVFAQENATEILTRWDDLAASLAERFPWATALMHQAREDVLEFRHFPQHHWRKVWSTNLLERVNEEKGRRTRVVGLFPTSPPSSAWWPRCCWSRTSTGCWRAAACSPPRAWPAIRSLADLPALQAACA
jgi:putative transposase